jgi:ATP-dependent DNA helicase RecG
MTDQPADLDAVLASIGTPWNASQVEYDGLDFKETPATAHGDTGPKAMKRYLALLAETAVCFANAAGGTIVIGVRDKAATREDALVGVDPTRYPVEDLVRAIFDRTSPSITPQATLRAIDDRIVYGLRIRQGNGVHSTTEGVYKIRVGDRCVPLEGEDLRGLRTIREHYDWSAQPSGVEVSALSRAAFERAATRLRAIGNDDLALLAEQDPSAFLQATRLLTKGEVTNAAVLLYGSPPALHSIHHWGVNVQTRESPGGEPRVLLRRDTTQAPLVMLLDQLIALVGALAQAQSVRIGAEQVELVDYPDDALREIFANAFAHRDWEVPGVVEIIHSPDELVVSSPGGLLPTLLVDRLLHDAAEPRNPLLAAHMARLRLAELSGLGLDRTFRAIARLGKEPPHLEDGIRFRVTVPGGRGDEVFARFLRSPIIPDVLARDVDVLMVLTALRHSRTISASSLAARIQRDVANAQRVLHSMAQAGLVAPTLGTTRRAQPSYTLTPTVLGGLRQAVTYRTSSIDGDDWKIIRHLRRHGRIANEDVRNYLDCDIATARNRLTRLRSRGLIDFAPDSPRRGPNVVYVKTAKLDVLPEDD